MDFVKEGKLDEEKKKRQAEWERVRTKEDPIEAPPEAFDNRTLYDKLKEQHEIKKKEFEEQHSLKNQVRGVDSEEADFLTEVDNARIKREREIKLEERKEVEEVKKAATSSAALSAGVCKITVNLPESKKENKQAALLSHAVVSKRKIPATSTDKQTTDKSSDKVVPTVADHKADTSDDDASAQKRSKGPSDVTSDLAAPRPFKAQTIVLGVLPGVGAYDSDSSNNDSDNSDSDIDCATIAGAKLSGASSAAAKLTNTL